MSSTSRKISSTEPPGLPPPIRWRIWPLRDAPARTLLTAVGLLAAALMVRWLTGRTYLALLALVALGIAFWRLVVPVAFELNHQGVGQRVLGRERRIAWQAICRHEIGPDGVLLLPDENPSPLAPFRGLYLPWASHRDEVLAQISRYLGRPAESQAELHDSGS